MFTSSSLSRPSRLLSSGESKGLLTGAALGALLTTWYLLFISSGSYSCNERPKALGIHDDIPLNLDGFEWGTDKGFFGVGYMNKRIRNITYYKSVLRLAQQYAPDAQSVIDVGAPWPFVTAFEWIPRKVMLNDRYPDGLATPPDVTAIMANFYEYQPEQKFDLVVCNQVMEHVPDPPVFAKKLLSIGKVVVASVPYMWPPGTATGHLQNDIDMETFLSWFGRRDYSEIGIVQEVQRNCGASCRRIYVVFQPTVPSSQKIWNPTHRIDKSDASAVAIDEDAAADEGDVAEGDTTMQMPEP